MFTSDQLVKHFSLKCLPSITTKKKLPRNVGQKQRKNSVQYRKKCSIETLYTAKWLNFRTKSQVELSELFRFSQFTTESRVCSILRQKLDIIKLLTHQKCWNLFSAKWKSNCYLQALAALGNFAAYNPTLISASLIGEDIYCTTL